MKKILLAALLFAACPKPVTPTPPVIPAPSALPRELKITSECDAPIWIQQQNHTGSPEIVALTKGKSASYPIPAEGLASTRYWAKSGCDKDGQNCKVGQSSPPCPATGCAPPVDSKLEATWGCLLPKEQCAITPQGHHLANTFFNSSAVDGYTLPYRIEVSAIADGCLPVDCSELEAKNCPLDEDLSQGFTEKFPADAKVDLAVAGEEGACYSPCMALGYPTFGGKGIQPPSDPRAAPYCCPTPPVSSPECRGGPVVDTKYVKAIHEMCNNTAYAYAYDDGIGGRSCDPKTLLTMTFCPGIPAAK